MTMTGVVKVSATLASNPNPRLPSCFTLPPLMCPSPFARNKTPTVVVQWNRTGCCDELFYGCSVEQEGTIHRSRWKGIIGKATGLGSLSAYIRLEIECPCVSVKLSGSSSRGAASHDVKRRWPGIALNSCIVHGPSRRSSELTGDYQLFPNSIGQDMEIFLINAINMNFFQRLNLAWMIFFPSQMTYKVSNARLANQRLKMILFSDRCAVSDEAKQKIVTNIVHALSDFVEIESRDKVQLTVATDEDLGTIYSVTMPVRRVKPAYQDSDEVGLATVDVRFDFLIPDESAP